jgi:hypothetical protein
VNHQKAKQNLGGNNFKGSNCLLRQKRKAALLYIKRLTTFEIEPQTIILLACILTLHFYQVNAAHLLVLLTDERCQVPPPGISVLHHGQDDWQQQLEHWAMRIKGGDVPVQTLVKQIGRDMRRACHQAIATKLVTFTRSLAWSVYD